MVHFHVCVPRNIFLLYLALPARSFSLQREISDEVKMLHSEFITGIYSGKYLSMCLSPVEIVRT